jgi:KUP system potassium uptake protein
LKEQSNRLPLPWQFFMQTESQTDNRYLFKLALGALGVVYGDIGTSPLYALRECFSGPHSIPVTPANVLGVLSLIFWTLILLVSIKYLYFFLRADNRGEGGILALLALAFPSRGGPGEGRVARGMILVGLFGTALLYGDGIITPAISVLSAVEGLAVATSVFQPAVVPITIVILVGLFSIQRHGTGKVGNVFGRVTAVWFTVLIVLGIKGIMVAPGVLAAINPFYAIKFFFSSGWAGFIVLGSVFLVVTGAEALYADMGHFGKRAIRIAWFALVLPALALNYFGQGALLLSNPAAAQNPFYLLAPGWALYPLVILATAATVIASQALISGAFSLTMQAVQLGYLPRLKIEHTSSTERGQVYLGVINRTLMLACIGVVLLFRSSSNLAAAYGIAVALTMLITTMLFYFAAPRLWGWSPAKTAMIVVPFALLQIAFFGANLLKVSSGGWLPLFVGLSVFTLLTTWKRGRELLGAKLQRATLPLELLFQDIAANPPNTARGTAIYLSGRVGSAPLALLHNLKHNKVLHRRVVFLTISSRDTPYVDDESRLSVETLQEGIYRVIGTYGFMETPDIPKLLKGCKSEGLDLNPNEVSYFLSKETIIPARSPGMPIWRERLFSLMSRNATSPTNFYKLPPSRVIELGMQVEL